MHIIIMMILHIEIGFTYFAYFAYYFAYIWNPDHLDKNGQNGMYVAEHGTDMSVHVHKVTYNSEHVCTCYVHVHKYR